MGRRSRRKVTCIFCAQRKWGGEEHVVPRWIREQLGITTEVAVTGVDGTTRRMPHLAVKLRNMVCEDCNNTWMSGMETSVQDFLSPMLVHQGSVVLDAVQQRDLARWAVMKVLLLEYAARQQHASLKTVVGYAPSQAELAWLFAKDEPPPCRVWLGAFDAENRVLVTTQAVDMTPVPAAGRAPIPAHRTTITVGYVLFQVYSTDFVLADAQQLPHSGGNPPELYAQALPRIWPPEKQAVTLPVPGMHVTQDILERVVNWGNPSPWRPTASPSAG